MAICGCVMVALLVTALRAAPQSFDVAFIKPNYESFDTGMHRTPGRLTATASVKGLISIASDMPEFRVTGGPAWAGSLRFAIIATTPMYALVVAKGGVKLSPPTTDSRAGLTGVNVAPSMLEEFLTQELWRPVQDQTGLKGRYDFKLNWSRSDDFSTPSEYPSIFVALREQVGLNLISKKAPIDFIVIDHLERPSQN